MSTHGKQPPDEQATGINPGKAGPKGALDNPQAQPPKGRNEDKNEQRNFVQLTDEERKRTRLEDDN